MNKSLITSIILVNSILFSVLGNTKEKASQVDEQAWCAITNKWFSGDKGSLLNQLKKVLRDEPIEVKLVLNGYLSDIIPNVRIYQTGIVNIYNNGIRDKTSLVIDGSRLKFVETDDDAVSYLNSNRCQKVFSMVRAVQDVMAFGELRGYTIMTDETWQLLKGSMSDQSKIGSWSFSVREGEKESLVEATFLTFYEPGSSSVIFSKRFTFIFRRDGKMKLAKVEDAGYVGGFK
jgi:hypothetical protein